MADIAVSNIQYPVEKYVEATVAFDSSYPTGGESISAVQFGMSRFNRLVVQVASGYICQPIIAAGGATALLKMYRSAGFTPAGIVAAPTFTPASTAGDLNLAAGAFTGTGLTAAGQVMTTTSTHTMTLNQCAGMWLLPATGATPPMLIVSNTAVTAAPAVLTVIGAAATDAGAYKIVRVNTAGTNSAPVFTGTAVAEDAMNEVDAATDLSALSAVVLQAWGY